MFGDLDRLAKSAHQGFEICLCKHLWLQISLQLEISHWREFAYFQALSANSYKPRLFKNLKNPRLKVHELELYLEVCLIDVYSK